MTDQIGGAEEEICTPNSADATRRLGETAFGNKKDKPGVPGKWTSVADHR